MAARRLLRAAGRALRVTSIQQVLAAVQAIDYRLRIYPQFGEPLRDLVLVPARLWIGVVAPLTVQYILDEDSRAVMIIAPFRPLPRVGF